jgi:hypothetical protein
MPAVLRLVFLLVAIILFCISFVGPATGRFNLMALGLAFGFASFLEF